MLRIADGQIVTLWEINSAEKHTEVRLSSSRKDKATGNYLNTSWSFVSFVGKAHEKMKTGEFKGGDRIRLKGAGLSREPYLNQAGERVWPKNVRFVVFDFVELEPFDESSSPSGMDAGPTVEDDGEMPF